MCSYLHFLVPVTFVSLHLDFVLTINDRHTRTYWIYRSYKCRRFVWILHSSNLLFSLDFTDSTGNHVPSVSFYPSLIFTYIPIFDSLVQTIYRQFITSVPTLIDTLCTPHFFHRYSETFYIYKFLVHVGLLN